MSEILSKVLVLRAMLTHEASIVNEAGLALLLESPSQLPRLLLDVARLLENPALGTKAVEVLRPTESRDAGSLTNAYASAEEVLQSLGDVQNDSSDKTKAEFEDALKIKRSLIKTAASVERTDRLDMQHPLVCLVVDALRDRDETVRLAAAQGVCQAAIAPYARQALNTIHLWLTDQSPDERFAKVAEAMFLAIGRASSAQLTNCLRNTELVITQAGSRPQHEVEALVPIVKARTVRILGKLRAESSVRWLAPMVKDANPAIRTAAAQALLDIGPCDELRSEIASVMDALFDGQADIVEDIENLVVALGGSSITWLASKTIDTAQKPRALRLIQRIAQQNIQAALSAIKPLSEQIEHEAPEIQMLSALTLGTFGNLAFESAGDILGKLAEDGDPHCQEVLRIAYQAVSTNSPELVDGVELPT